MLYQVYNYNTNEILGEYQDGLTRYGLPSSYIDIFAHIKRKYGDDAFCRPHVNPIDFGYRDVKIAEITPGLTCLMVHDPHHIITTSHSLRPLGTTIKVSRMEPRTFSGVSPNGLPWSKSTDYVFYYCIEPQWESECFVPLSDFINLPSSGGGGPQTRYWIENSG